MSSVSSTSSMSSSGGPSLWSRQSWSPSASTDSIPTDLSESFGKVDLPASSLKWLLRDYLSRKRSPEPKLPQKWTPGSRLAPTPQPSYQLKRATAQLDLVHHFGVASGGCRSPPTNYSDSDGECDEDGLVFMRSKGA